MGKVDGIKLVKSLTNTDTLRVLAASNIVSDKKVLLKLNLKGIANGEVLVDITRGRVPEG